MNINEQLRLLREGTVDTADEQDFDTELVESWFIDSDDFLSESADDSQFGDLIMEMVTLVEAGTADPKQTLSLLTKLRLKWRQFKDKFDPHEGIKHLKLVRTTMERSRSNIHVSASGDDIFGTIVSLAIAGVQILATARNYKNMKRDDIKAYIAEAELFRDGLYKQIHAAEEKHDFKAEKRLKRILKKLDIQIAQFKKDSRVYGGHIV